MKNLRKMARKLNGECLDFTTFKKISMEKKMNLLPFKMRINLKKILNLNEISYPEQFEIRKKKLFFIIILIFIIKYFFNNNM